MSKSCIDILTAFLKWWHGEHGDGEEDGNGNGDEGNGEEPIEYGVCKDIDILNFWNQHKIVWKLLDPKRIGVSLTERFQMNPEYSTAAIIVYHPQAIYFNMES